MCSVCIRRARSGISPARSVEVVVLVGADRDSVSFDAQVLGIELDKSPRGLRNIGYLEGKGPAVLEALDDVASETGSAPASVALAWTKAQPAITAPIASATSLDQLSEMVAALTLDLTTEQIALLNAASA